MPPDLRPQPPGDVHAAVVAQHHAAIVERRHLGSQQRLNGHVVVGDGQPLDDAGLDVLEDVSAEAVQGVGLAVVTDHQQPVRRCAAVHRAAAAGGERRQRQEE
jgi:hypothetical protein